MIEPTASLKAPKSIDVWTDECRCEPDQPQGQEEQVISKHYYK